jgi:hypothetical protein
MGERYDAYFREQLDRFSTERIASNIPFADEASRIVKEGVRRLDLAYPYTIKPEGEYFLAVVLHAMILGPTASVDRQALVDIRERLPKDVVTILEEAVRRTAAASDTDITGHAVVDAINATWPHLAATSGINWEE